MFGWTLAAGNLTFEEIMGDLKKIYHVDWFRGEKLARIYLGEMISCNGKNFPHDLFNAEKKQKQNQVYSLGK